MCHKRSQAHCGTDWQFTNKDARTKLKRIHPSIWRT
jgi:hypothetical protein